jgi:Uma2 family endonuclease
VTTFHLSAIDTWTVDELADLPPTLRYELHDGRLVIMPPAKVWHEEIAARIRAILRSAGRLAVTNVGVLRTKGDMRVPDVAVFREEPDPNAAWHKPDHLSLVVEVWSPSSDEKDHGAMQWYADRGIPEYWLATPVEGERWGASITRYKLARTAAGETTYVEVDTTALSALENG